MSMNAAAMMSANPAGVSSGLRALQASMASGGPLQQLMQGQMEAPLQEQAPPQQGQAPQPQIGSSTSMDTAALMQAIQQNPKLLLMLLAALKG